VDAWDVAAAMLGQAPLVAVSVALLYVLFTHELQEIKELNERIAERLNMIHLTDIALNLYEFQYNGLDPEGVVSRYTNLEDVERDVKYLAEKTMEWARKESYQTT
jgi:enoyl reductase-like protein